MEIVHILNNQAALVWVVVVIPTLKHFYMLHMDWWLFEQFVDIWWSNTLIVIQLKETRHLRGKLYHVYIKSNVSQNNKMKVIKLDVFVFDQIRIFLCLVNVNVNE